MLDGLVGALRNHHSIQVAKPARLIDFERFAEAGCRALGFRDWEFVEAYAANRKRSLIVSLEGSAVGRAVLAFMNTKAGREKGFTGKMSDLLDKLSIYGNGSRDWPKDATREYNTQKGVILTWSQ